MKRVQFRLSGLNAWLTMYDDSLSSELLRNLLRNQG